MNTVNGREERRLWCSFASSTPPLPPPFSYRGFGIVVLAEKNIALDHCHAHISCPILILLHDTSSCAAIAHASPPLFQASTPTLAECGGSRTVQPSYALSLLLQPKLGCNRDKTLTPHLRTVTDILSGKSESSRSCFSPRASCCNLARLQDAHPPRDCWESQQAAGAKRLSLRS